MIVKSLAAIGGAALLLLMAGVFLDFREFDRTSGGYEPPYEDWTGTPIDFASAYRTETGLFKDGRVISSHVDCGSGMVSLIAAGVWFDWRPLSPRAIAVHAPREACRARGFEAGF
jgi:hypothetical protein